MNDKTTRLVFIALLAALCCVATMVIPIPTPTGGYLNAGDIVVVLSAMLAGPFYGAAAAGVGSVLADLFAGYVVYAPGTLIAKGLAAMVIGLIWRSGRQNLPAAIFAGVCGELVMALVYFLYESLCLGFGWAAAAEIPGNLLQGAVGIVGGLALYHALIRVPEIRRFSEQIK